MKKALPRLGRLIGFKRTAPKTKVGRFLRHCERTLTVLTVMYAGLQFFPQVAFAHSVTSQGITVYAQRPLPPSVVASINRASVLLSHSELNTHNRQERVFICDSPWLFRLFGPAQAGAFAFSVPLTNHIFMTSTDMAHDRVRTRYNTRKLSSVMAHEITHGLIRARLGLARAMRLPDWVAEGYCDYVAQESSFPADKGFQLMKSGGSENSLPFRYFVYRQMVQHLVKDEHLSFEQIVGRANDFDAVKLETLRTLQKRSSAIQPHATRL